MRQRASTGFLDIPAAGAGPPVRTAGVDLVDVDRLRLAVVRCGPPLLARIFDPDERRACAGDAGAAFTAGVFGVKESVVKAVGGLPVGGRLADIGVDVAGLDVEGPATMGGPDGFGPAGGGPRPVRLRGALSGRGDELGVRLVAGQVSMSPDLVLTWALGLAADRRPEPVR